MFDYITYKDNRGKDEIADWIEKLGKKAITSKNERIQLKKLFEYLEVLMDRGTRAGEPYIKHLQDEIWELRPTDNRVLFAYFKNNIFILLHYFLKTTKKTPPREIEQAKRNLKEFLERGE